MFCETKPYYYMTVLSISLPFCSDFGRSGVDQSFSFSNSARRNTRRIQFPCPSSLSSTGAPLLTRYSPITAVAAIEYGFYWILRPRKMLHDLIVFLDIIHISNYGSPRSRQKHCLAIGTELTLWLHLHNGQYPFCHPDRYSHQRFLSSYT